MESADTLTELGYAASRKAVSDMVCGEKACLFSIHPGRLRSLEAGLDSLHLIRSLLVQVCQELSRSQQERERLAVSCLPSAQCLHCDKDFDLTRIDVQECVKIARLAGLLGDLSQELSHLAAGAFLDYGRYQAILRWLSVALGSAATHSQVKLSALLEVLQRARRNLDQSGGRHQLFLWRSFLDVSLSSTGSVKAIYDLLEKCDVSVLPPGG